MLLSLAVSLSEARIAQWSAPRHLDDASLARLQARRAVIDLDRGEAGARRRALRVAAPGEELGLGHATAIGRITDRRRIALGDNLSLGLGAPPPPPTSAREHLNPTRRRHHQHIITRHHQHTKPARPSAERLRDYTSRGKVGSGLRLRSVVRFSTKAFTSARPGASGAST